MPYLCMQARDHPSMEQYTVFSAIKLIKHNSLLVKEPKRPVVFKLHITDPLTTAQMRMLAAATPYRPLTVTAQTGSWNDALKSMNATITTIESLPKPIPLKHSKTLRWGLMKRKHGFLSHDSL